MGGMRDLVDLLEFGQVSFAPAEKKTPPNRLAYKKTETHGAKSLTESARAGFRMFSWIPAPVVDSDGIIYFGSNEQYLCTNPVGTLKWSFDTGAWIPVGVKNFLSTS